MAGNKEIMLNTGKRNVNLTTILRPEDVYDEL